MTCQKQLANNLQKNVKIAQRILSLTVANYSTSGMRACFMFG